MSFHVFRQLLCRAEEARKGSQRFESCSSLRIVPPSEIFITVEDVTRFLPSFSLMIDQVGLIALPAETHGEDFYSFNI